MDTMPKYSDHLIVNTIAITLFITALPFLGVKYTLFQALLFTAFYLIGTIWITPDIDTRSEATRRCGTLCKPYSHLFKHRGLSHHPFWGIISKLTYVLIILLLIMAGIGALTQDTLSAILPFISEYKKEAMVALMGFAVSNVLHTLTDWVS